MPESTADPKPPWLNWLSDAEEGLKPSCMTDGCPVVEPLLGRGSKPSAACSSAVLKWIPDMMVVLILDGLGGMEDGWLCFEEMKDCCRGCEYRKGASSRSIT